MSGIEKSKNLKSEVNAALLSFMDALCAKDIKRMMAHYADDVVVFDVKPPLQIKGAVAWKHAWEASLPFFPETFRVELKDLVIYQEGHLALAFYFFRLQGPEKDHPAMQTWLRATTGYRYQQGKWKIVHEHGSLPFSPETNQAVFNLQP